MVQKFLQELLQGHWYKILPGGRKQKECCRVPQQYCHYLNDWQQSEELI